MDLPHSLPGRLYLLAYDRERRRLRGGGHLGYALRAAALADLHLSGHLVDEHGKVHTAIGPTPTDPVLRAILEQVAESKPRSWSSWVQRSSGKTTRDLRDHLETGGWIRVEPRRILGIIPADEIGLRNEHLVSKLMSEMRSAIRAGGTSGRVDPRVAALAALAAVGELPTVLGWSERRQYKPRIAELTERAGPAIPALRKAIQHAAASSGG